MSKISDEERREICLCPLEGVIDVIARKWSLFAINVIGNGGEVRFNEIMERLEGISPTTLTETLEKLVDKQLIKREAYAETPPRVEYSLTKDGHELREAIIPLLTWAARRDPEKSATGPSCSVFAKLTTKRKA